MHVNVETELTRCGQTWERAGEDEIRLLCPFHTDTHPSCFVNIVSGAFKCHACGASGDFVHLLAEGILKQPRAVILLDFSKRYGHDSNIKLVEATVIERYHDAIWKASTLLNELYRRGVTDKIIRRWRLGAHQDRVTIPIKNEFGLYVNIRYYQPGAPGPKKMRSQKGRGQARFFPIDQLAYDTLVYTGGEIKALVALEELNAHNIGALTICQGEQGQIRSDLLQRLRDKTIYVIYDIDHAGRTAANSLCSFLSKIAKVYNITLPLDVVKYPKGDINDWVGSGQLLLPLLQQATEWVAATAVVSDDEPYVEVGVGTCSESQYAKKRIQLTATVTALDPTPYVIPAKISVTCSRDQKECAICPIWASAETELYTLSPENESILELIGASRAGVTTTVRSMLGIPITCKTACLNVQEHYNVEDARLGPSIELTDVDDVSKTMMPAICIGHGLELNETYEVRGRMFPSPSTQQSLLLVSKWSTKSDSLSSYECDDLDSLQIFQPRGGIAEQLDDLYHDLENNVTRIFFRRDLHLAVDLGYFSPLLFNLDGKTVKGWTEILIIGDSAQGKTETAMGMRRHYGLGTKVECENASVAGLLGGLQQLGTRWFVTWGVIPTNDRRLVILEELKGASVEVISKLTDMRSSGIAEIPKIEKRRTRARTRLIALSNPRSEHAINTYSFGVDTIRELIGGLEDIRRFDFSLICAAHEIQATQLSNVLKTVKPSPIKYTAELSRKLVLWAWTRRTEDVVFTAPDMLLDVASDLCDRFTDAIPLVDRGSTRYKVARLSAALAARLFSTEDGKTLLVKPEHITFIADLIKRVYGSPVFGLGEFTDAIRMNESLEDEELVIRRINNTPFPRDMVKQLIRANNIDAQDVSDWTGWDRPDAIELLSFFVRKHCLKRTSRSYRKTSAFIAFLRQLLVGDKLIDRPSHIREEF